MTLTAGPAPRTNTPAVDARRWPDIAAVPHAPLRGAVARTLLRRAAALSGVAVEGPRTPPTTGPALRLLRPDEFYARVATDGLIGFGEAWMSGAWTSDDVHGVLHAMAVRLRDVVPRPMQRLRRWYDHRMPAGEDGDRRGARRNIARHYDLSNDLFALFLDRGMTYSSALFEPGDDLETAQNRKLEAVLDAAGVRAGTRLLEIGTGWGSLAIQAARRGADVTTITISQEQRDLAAQRVRAAGLADRVDVRLCDFRDVYGNYDAIVSIEMLEAVGERHWPDYFGRLGRLLAPGGRVALQAITMEHDHLLATRNSWGWIHKYVFPGGLIPSIPAIREHARDSGLEIWHRRAFGRHYAETLRLWRARFAAAHSEVLALGFDEVFCRMWDFYLAYSQAGFSSGHIDVEQIVLGRGAVR